MTWPRVHARTHPRTHTCTHTSEVALDSRSAPVLSYTSTTAEDEDEDDAKLAIAAFKVAAGGRVGGVRQVESYTSTTAEDEDDATNLCLPLPFVADNPGPDPALRHLLPLPFVADNPGPNPALPCPALRCARFATSYLCPLFLIKALELFLFDLVGLFFV